MDAVGGSTDKKKKLVWTVECEQAFQQVKQLVVKDTMLAFPSFNL